MLNPRSQAVAKMRAADVDETAIRVFEHYYDQVAAGATGIIAENDIEPVTDPVDGTGIDRDREACRDALAQTVIIKLNGGLGTSMGLARAKTLLQVRDGLTFLDIIARQVLATRAEYDVELPVVFMNSFRTHDDTLAALGDYPGLSVDGIDLDFVQNQEPKLTADTLEPVSWPVDPSLEWCPPGHGDLFTVVWTSGVLDALRDRGYRYASVSNGDNLGAAPSPELAAWFAASGAPFAMEVCRRTPNDRKGGHVTRRRADGRLVLRDTAMTAEQDLPFFADEHRHPYFNSNNLWFDLDALADKLEHTQGILGLPLIRNTKTVDPADPTSTSVVQIETGMGTAIEVFDGAAAIEVPRSRFLPVKTTDELLLLRSDLYELTADYRLEAQAAAVPDVQLDRTYYGTIDAFTQRIPVAPSLRDARSLTVAGDWTFADDVRVVGDASLSAHEAPGVASGVIGHA